MRTLTTALATAALLLSTAAAPTVAGAETYTVDKSHSYIGFKVKHMMVSWVRGEFADYTVDASIDGSDLSTLTAEVTIQVASIDTQEPKRDEHLRGADFFDAETHPTITFVAKRAKPAGDGAFKLIGDLTIRGVTKEVTLDVEGGLTPIADPWGNQKLGFTAATTIDRQAFGVTWNKSLDAGGVVVGDQVRLVIEVELNQVQ